MLIGAKECRPCISPKILKICIWFQKSASKRMRTSPSKFAKNLGGKYNQVRSSVHYYEKFQSEVVARSVQCFNLGASIAFRILPPLDAALCCGRWFFPDFTCLVARCTMPRRVKFDYRKALDQPSFKPRDRSGWIDRAQQPSRSLVPPAPEREIQNGFFVRTRESDSVAYFGRPFQRLPKFCWCIV